MPTDNINERDKIKDKIQDLINLSNTIVYNFNNINKYEISDQRVEYLETENSNLSNIKAELEYIITDLQSKLTDTDDILNDYYDKYIENARIVKKKGQYKTINNKVLTIEIEEDKNNIYSFKIIHDNGNIYIWENQDLIESKPLNTNINTFNLKKEEFLSEFIVYKNSINEYAIYIKTSKGNKKTYNPANINLTIGNNNKEYKIDGDNLNWLHHYRINQKDGWKLASISNVNEYRKINKLLKDENVPRAYLGGIKHANMDSKGTNARFSDTWKWTDETPFENISQLFFGKQPDNWKNRERYLEIVRDKGLNDTYWNKKKPAVYSRTIIDIPEKILDRKSNDEQLVFFEPYIIKKYIIDNTVVDEAKKALDNLKNYKKDIKKYKNYIEDTILDIDDTINIIDRDIESNENIIDEINNLNNFNSTETFTNISESNIFNNIFINIKNMFIKENFTSEYTSEYYDKRRDNVNKITTSINNELRHIDDFQYNQNRNMMLELATQQNNLFSNMIMDNIINNQNDSSVENIYEKYAQENQDTTRNININTYTYKTLNMYIDTVKITLAAVILMIIILFLKKYEIIGKNLTLSLIIAIIIGIIVVILYNLYELYTKDKYNFDKINFPKKRDKTNIEIDSETNNTVSNNSGCIGEECCDTNMEFNSDLNKCI